MQDPNNYQYVSKTFKSRIIHNLNNDDFNAFINEVNAYCADSYIPADSISITCELDNHGQYSITLMQMLVKDTIDNSIVQYMLVVDYQPTNHNTQYLPGHMIPDEFAESINKLARYGYYPTGRTCVAAVSHITNIIGQAMVKTIIYENINKKRRIEIDGRL